jgi:hypothetical protein
MDLYTFGLLLGATGLGVMGFAGVAQHVGADGVHADHAHVLHGGQTHASGGVQTHASGGVHELHPGHAGHVAHAAEGPGHTGLAHGHLHQLHQAFAWLVSPRVLFGILLGWGTAGLVLRPLLGGALLFAVALALGVAFERIVLNTLWNFTLRFASRPALTLEAAVAGEATAVTAFDESGHGIVQIEIDGQVVQVLGTLTRAQRELGHRVRAGETLRVEEVDPGRNRCLVSIS